MTSDDIISMLQKDVERLEEQAAEIPALRVKVEAMGREIGQFRSDTGLGFRRIEKSVELLADDTRNARRVQLGLAISIAGSSLILVIGLLIAFAGGPG